MLFKFLLVEDDAEIREIIIDYFVEKSGGVFDIDAAETGSEGQEKCLENEYDLILLDVMLPKNDGFTICREVRKKVMFQLFLLLQETMRMIDCTDIILGVTIIYPNLFRWQSFMQRLRL